MKLFIFLNLIFYAISANAENSEILKFASSIDKSIKNKNINKLKSLKCFPAQNSCVSTEAVEYIFTKNNKGSIHSLISNKNTKIKIYGPYTHETKHPNSSYVILFYNPEIIKFNKKGLLSVETEKEQWNKNLTETVVTLINGVPHLNRTIFYYGAHAPWAGNY